MRCAVLVIGTCLLAVTVTSGQWVESTIVLPDSLGPLDWPQALLFDSLNQTVYVGGEYGRCVIGIDPQTNRTKYRIGAGEDVRAFCLNTTDNKVYTADRFNNTVTVIAGGTGLVVRRIPVGLGPFALCWNSATNRVYCVNYAGNSVSVIDGAADTVVATVPVGSYPYAICCDWLANKLYCTSSAANSVSVIDGVTNQVVKTIPVGTAPLNLIYNPVSSKVYTADCFSNTISIINTVTDSIIATLHAPGAPRGLCFNPVNNKVYCGCEDDYDSGLVVIDGATDSIIAAPGVSYITALTHFPDSNRVYGVGQYGDVFCLDGASDALLAVTYVGVDIGAVCYDPISNQVFAAHYSSSGPAVYAFDGTTLDYKSVIGAKALPQAVLHSPVENKLYCANGTYNTVTVVDGVSNAILADIPVGVNPSLLALDATDNKLYCANTGDDWRDDSTLSVIDCAGDTVIETVPLGFSVRAMAWNRVLNRLYCADANGDAVTVLDCAADTIVGKVVVGRAPFVLCVNAEGTRVYTLNFDDYTVTAFDAVGDTLLGTIHLGTQPTTMVYNPANDRVYCALYYTGRVLVIGGTPPAVVDTVVTGGSHLQDMCYVPHENKVYVANHGVSKVTVIDCNTNTVIKQIPASATSGPFSCDTANRWVYCADATARTVSVMDAARDSIVAVLPAGDVVSLSWNSIDLRTYAANHDAGTITVLRDSLHVGVADRQSPAASRRPLATVIRGVLVLGAVDSRQNTAYRADLLDISGRKVLDLKPGANDVSHLAPGVYFVRVEPAAVSKVIVTR